MATNWDALGTRVNGPAPAAPQPSPSFGNDIVIAPPDPYKQAANARAQQDQALQVQAAGRDEERLRIARANQQRISQSPTEAQGKAEGLLTRAIHANGMFEQTGGSAPTAGGAGPRSYLGQKIADAAPDFKNLTDSSARQQAVTAQRDFISAILRVESGAAVSQSEFENYSKLYFPQPGDSPATLRAKAEERRSAMEALRVQAGPYGKDIVIPGMPADDAGGQAPAGAGVNPSGVPGVGDNGGNGGNGRGGAPGLINPTQRQIYADGVQFGDQLGNDNPFDRSEYLAGVGIGPGDEAKIAAMWSANVGNPNLTVENVKQWYAANGIRPPTDDAIAATIETANKPDVAGFNGFDTSQAEADYNQQLDALLKARGEDPESAIGATGVNAAEGLTLGALDELGGVGGAINAAAHGQNPVAGYQVERDAIRREQQRAREAHPYLSAGSEIVGSLPTAGIGFARAGQAGRLAAQAARMGNVERATMLGREAVRASIKPGAVTGGLYGFNTGEGSVSSSRNALAGAGEGAVVAPAAAFAANALARFTPGRVATRAPAAADVRRLSADTRIPIMTSDARPPRTFLGQVARATGERVPFIGTGGRRATQEEARRDAVRGVLSEYGGLTGLPAIDDVTAGLAARRSAELDKWSGIKRGIIDQVSEGIVPVPRATQAIDEQIARLRSLKTREVEPVIAKLSDWGQALQGQSLANIEELRKQVGTAFAAPDLASIRDIGEKALSAIYGPLREDMGAFIAQRAGRGVSARWQAANRRLSEIAGDLKNRRLRNVLQGGEITPEVAGNLLFSQKPSEIRALYNGLTDAGKANARAAIMQEVFRRIGGDVDEISPEKFVSAMRAVGKPVGIFFEGADKMRLDGLLRALKMTRRAAQASVAPPTGVQALPAILSGGLVALLGPVKGPAVGLSIGALAHIYESAPVRNLLLALARAEPNSAREATAFARLQGLLARESNVIPLADYMRPQPLAASEQPQGETR